MTRETEFARIKRAVDNEKTKKMQAEARLESITAEEARLLKEASDLAGTVFTTSAEVEAYSAKLKESIEKDIREMSGILNEEGVAY